MQAGRTGDERLINELLKEVPGTKLAPQQWFLDISKVWKDFGLEQGRVDPCSFFQHQEICSFLMHVDDGLGMMPRAYVKELESFLEKRGIKTRIFHVINVNEPFECLGEEFTELDNGIKRNKNAYIKTIEQLDISRHHTRKEDFESGGTIYQKFRKRLGKLIWVIDSRPEFKYDISVLAAMVSNLNLSVIHYLNDVISTLKENPPSIFLPKLG